MPDFSDAEKRILKYMKEGKRFIFNNEEFQIIKSGKPVCSLGEPKTDVYILAQSPTKEKEIKISYKKENADFIENKMKAERAEQLFGEDWEVIIEESTKSIKDRFYSRQLIYKEAAGRTEKGAITLGWKYELLNKPGGELSGKIDLTKEQVFNVYSGDNLEKEKRNAYVNETIINNSGVANYILVNNKINSTQSVIDNMVSIEDYIEEHPNIYFACKALNYRSFKRKWDGDRPLSVQVNWTNQNHKLESELIFNKPLTLKGNEMAHRLMEAMKELGIETTDDINDNNLNKRKR